MILFIQLSTVAFYSVHISNREDASRAHDKMIKLILFSTSLLLSFNAFAETRITESKLADVAIYPEVSIPASAISMNDAKISAEVRARVKSIPVLVGDTLKRGDTLVQLDNKDIKLNLLRAEVALKGIESRLKLADYQLAQAKTLIKDKAITDELLQQRQAEVTTLQAERDAQVVAVDMAKQELEKCTIRAPFDAVLVERLAQVGELANAGTAMVRIVDVSRIEVSVKIQPQDIASLQRADEFKFKTLDDSYNLKLRKLTPVIDPIQRNREARFIFADKLALTGSTGTLTWKQSIPHVPANLIVRRADKLGVFINKNNTADFIEISGISEGQPGPVNFGLETKLVIDGRFAIQQDETLTTE